jgi:hypothetical protein
MLFIFILVVHLTLFRILFFSRKLGTFGLSNGFTSWFCSYLTNQQSSVVFQELFCSFWSLTWGLFYLIFYQ